MARVNGTTAFNDDGIFGARSTDTVPTIGLCSWGDKIMNSEYFAAVGKASPPIVVSSAAAAGLSLQEWVFVATLLYTVLQIGLLIYNFVTRDRDEPNE